MRFIGFCFFSSSGKVRVSYTQVYGRTYEEWAEEKAKRILEVLRIFYLKGIPLDVQYFMKRLYWERLFYEGKYRWKQLRVDLRILSLVHS